MGLYAIPDDVLEVIFFHLESPVCLLQAASTCKHWRRVVSSTDFLRRFHSLHGPPVAAVYYESPCESPKQPNFVASPWAVDHAIDDRFFSLHFLPDSKLSLWHWRVQDSRGSLLLLDRRRKRKPQGSISYGDVFVCEPMSRRYERVNPIKRFKGFSIENAYLVDGESGGIGMENFRVVFRLHTMGIIDSDAGIFTMGKNRKRSWGKISIGNLMLRAGPCSDLNPGSVHWFNQGRNVAALDRSTAEFSCVSLPEVEDWNFHEEMYNLVLTAGHDGTARVVVTGAAGDLMVFARLKCGGEWALARREQLSEATRDLPGHDPSFFMGDEGTLIHSDGTPVIQVSPSRWDNSWFYLDVDTMEVEPAPNPDKLTAYPCELPWPPTLRACT